MQTRNETIKWDDIFTVENGMLIWGVKISNKNKGDLAGCKGARGYIRVRRGGVLYYAHRIIWEMHNGPIPEGMQIDHINHVRDDNRIENLRLVSHKTNHRNRTMQSNNSSGVTGVSWMSKINKWRAQIMVNQVTISLGDYDDFDCAVNARINAESTYGFHENHGVSH